MSSETFVDNFRVAKIADPEVAYKDVKACHAWVTWQLETAVEAMREYNLHEERKRLADIGWRLRDAYNRKHAFKR